MIATLPGSPVREVHDVPERIGRVRLVRVSERVWRALGADGRILGHLRATGAGAELRYEALRFHIRERGFRSAGAFWRPDDAVECLRLSR